MAVDGVGGKSTAASKASAGDRSRFTDLVMKVKAGASVIIGGQTVVDGGVGDRDHKKNGVITMTLPKGADKSGTVTAGDTVLKFEIHNAGSKDAYVKVLGDNTWFGHIDIDAKSGQSVLTFRHGVLFPAKTYQTYVFPSDLQSKFGYKQVGDSLFVSPWFSGAVLASNHCHYRYKDGKIIDSSFADLLS